MRRDMEWGPEAGLSGTRAKVMLLVLVVLSVAVWFLSPPVGRQHRTEAEQVALRLKALLKDRKSSSLIGVWERDTPQIHKWRMQVRVRPASTLFGARVEHNCQFVKYWVHHHTRYQDAACYLVLVGAPGRACYEKLRMDPYIHRMVIEKRLLLSSSRTMEDPEESMVEDVHELALALGYYYMAVLDVHEFLLLNGQVDHLFGVFKQAGAMSLSPIHYIHEGVGYHQCPLHGQRMYEIGVDFRTIYKVSSLILPLEPDPTRRGFKTLLPRVGCDGLPFDDEGSRKTRCGAVLHFGASSVFHQLEQDNVVHLEEPNRRLDAQMLSRFSFQSSSFQPLEDYCSLPELEMADPALPHL